MRSAESDPRTIRTRTLLQKALMELAAEKGMSSLTIQELTSRAGLNRTTFYLHYTGLHELLEECARRLFDEMREEIFANKEGGSEQEVSRFEPFVESVFRHLEKHARFYRTMLGKQGDPFFRALFQDLLSELIFAPISGKAPPHLSSDPFGMAMLFYSAGFSGIAAWWLENGMPIPVEQASRQIARDILPGYMRLMGSRW